MRKLLTAAAALALAIPAYADVLRLSNGSTVEGTYLGGDSREIKFLRENGSVRSYRVAEFHLLSMSEGGPFEPVFPPPADPRQAYP